MHNARLDGAGGRASVRRSYNNYYSRKIFRRKGTLIMYHTMTSRALLLCACSALLAFNVPAQTSTAAQQVTSTTANARAAATSEDSTAAAPSEMEEIRRLLRQQQEELERMRALINEQSSTIDSLRQRVELTEQRAAAPGIVRTGDIALSDSTMSAPGQSATQNPPSTAIPTDEGVRLGRVEEQVKKTTETLARQLGSVSFSGDVRIRYESFYGQLNALPNGDNPAIVGNPLSTRGGFRLRARLNMRGQLTKEFDWGLRLTTGSFANAISGNQTLTDFYNRKPFALDNAFIGWTPQRVPGLRIQAGKFDVPWVRTEMTIDNDLTPEGFAETYSRGFKNLTLKNLTFVAWQLPFLERASAFVRNADGTVNVSESHRAGRDLALYGAQVRARLEPTPTIGLTLSVADLFYSGTQFISPIQVIGNQLQLPVTFTIPATANTPAQTITTQVSIPRDFLVSGGSTNLGISPATTNAINRDGRLASGFNLIDFIGRLDLTSSKRWPTTLIFNFVHNTQTHDVSVAGPGGTTLFLNNDENNGYWAEIQVGRARERGDWLLGYTFIRIEKDAVLTPFNASDVLQPSDVLTHRFTVNYMADPHVLLTFTSYIGQRPNGLLGVFGATPPGSLGGATTRLQFDTIFRF